MCTRPKIRAEWPADSLYAFSDVFGLITSFEGLTTAGEESMPLFGAMDTVRTGRDRSDPTAVD